MEPSLIRNRNGLIYISKKIKEFKPATRQELAIKLSPKANNLDNVFQSYKTVIPRNYYWEEEDSFKYWLNSEITPIEHFNFYLKNFKHSNQLPIDNSYREFLSSFQSFDKIINGHISNKSFTLLSSTDFSRDNYFLNSAFYAFVCRHLDPLKNLESLWQKSTKNIYLNDKKYQDNICSMIMKDFAESLEGKHHQWSSDSSVSNYTLPLINFKGFPDLAASMLRSSPLSIQLGLSTRASKELREYNLNFIKDFKEEWLKDFKNMKEFSQMKSDEMIIKTISEHIEFWNQNDTNILDPAFRNKHYSQDFLRFNIPQHFETSFTHSLVDQNLNLLSLLDFWESFSQDKPEINFSEIASILFFIQSKNLNLKESDQGKKIYRIVKNQNSIFQNNTVSVRNNFNIKNIENQSKSKPFLLINPELKSNLGKKLDGKNLFIESFKFILYSSKSWEEFFEFWCYFTDDNVWTSSFFEKLDSSKSMEENYVDFFSRLEGSCVEKNGANIKSFNIEFNCSWAAARDFITHKSIFSKEIKRSNVLNWTINIMYPYFKELTNIDYKIPTLGDETWVKFNSVDCSVLNTIVKKRTSNASNIEYNAISRCMVLLNGVWAYGGESYMIKIIEKRVRWWLEDLVSRELKLLTDFDTKNLNSDNLEEYLENKKTLWNYWFSDFIDLDDKDEFLQDQDEFLQIYSGINNKKFSWIQKNFLIVKSEKIKKEVLITNLVLELLNSSKDLINKK